MSNGHDVSVDLSGDYSRDVSVIEHTINSNQKEIAEHGRRITENEKVLIKIVTLFGIGSVVISTIIVEVIRRAIP